jgi:hypothetical protein
VREGKEKEEKEEKSQGFLMGCLARKESPAIEEFYKWEKNCKKESSV